jgi:hypothetical protein
MEHPETGDRCNRLFHEGKSGCDVFHDDRFSLKLLQWREHHLLIERREFRYAARAVTVSQGMMLACRWTPASSAASVSFPFHFSQRRIS